MFQLPSFFNLLCPILLIGFLSCSSSKTLTNTEEILLLLDGNRYNCEESETGYCNRISYNTNFQNATWEFWDGKIEGIDIKPSNIYQMKVIKTEQIDKKTKETKNVAFQFVELIKKEPYSREGRKNYSFLGKLKEEGVKFYIRGNEPGWMIDIYTNRNIKFSSMSERKLNFVTDITQVEVVEKTGMRTYIFQDPEARLEIIAEKCEDSMSGEKFTHQVTFNIGGKSLKGCGMAVPDLRLNDIFVFESILGARGEEIKMTFEEKPYIEFNIDQMKLFGFGGCNEYGGNFEFEEEKIKIGPLMASRKACPGLSEPELMKFLSNRTLQYDYSELILTLTASDGQKSRWRKVD